jgi:hypothetical protein
MLSSLESYSQTIYTFLDTTTLVRGHTILVYPRGVSIGVLEGKVEFSRDIVLRVYERLDFLRQRIAAYSYEVWQGQQQLYWYDHWEHAEDTSLASSFPHHKHLPPDIKHHRAPAPELSFTRPNLPFLVEEIERTLLSSPEGGNRE